MLVSFSVIAVARLSADESFVCFSKISIGRNLG